MSVQSAFNYQTSQIQLDGFFTWKHCLESVRKTCFWYVVASLDADTASQVSCALKDTPKGKKYESLEALLLKTYDLTPLEWSKHVFSITDLGDRHPS